MGWQEQKALEERRVKILAEINELSAIENKTEAQKEKRRELTAQAAEWASDFESSKAARNLDSAFNPVMDKKDIKNYNLFRAIDAMASGKQADGLEREVSDEIARRYGKEARGLMIPVNTLLQRDVTTTTGAGVIAEEIKGDVIHVLRANTVLGQAGARFMNGLVGNVAIPKVTTGATSYWITTEGADPTESNPAIGSVDLSPKTVGNYVEVTRTLMKQTSGSAQQILTEDMLNGLSVALDGAGFQGADGTTGEPEGIYSNSSVTTVATDGTDGAALTRGTALELIESVAINNALLGSLHFVTSPQGYFNFRNIELSSNTAKYLISDDGKMEGFPVHMTTSIPVNLEKGGDSDLTALYFGNFNDCVVGIWGDGVDVVVDPYSKANMTRVTALLDCDIRFRNPKSFAKCISLSH